MSGSNGTSSSTESFPCCGPGEGSSGSPYLPCPGGGPGRIGCPGYPPASPADAACAAGIDGRVPGGPGGPCTGGTPPGGNETGGTPPCGNETGGTPPAGSEAGWAPRCRGGSSPRPPPAGASGTRGRPPGRAASPSTGRRPPGRRSGPRPPGTEPEPGEPCPCGRGAPSIAGSGPPAHAAPERRDSGPVTGARPLRAGESPCTRDALFGCVVSPCGARGSLPARRCSALSARGPAFRRPGSRPRGPSPAGCASRSSAAGGRPRRILANGWVCESSGTGARDLGCCLGTCPLSDRSADVLSSAPSNALRTRCGSARRGPSEARAARRAPGGGIRRGCCLRGDRSFCSSSGYLPVTSASRLALGRRGGPGTTRARRATPAGSPPPPPGRSPLVACAPSRRAGTGSVTP